MSENPKKFPLLRLPSVAAEHVIMTMKLRDVFILSLTSTKAKALLNCSLPKKQAHINCSFLGQSSFDIQFFPWATSTSFIRVMRDPGQFQDAGGDNSYKIHNILCKISFMNEPTEFIADQSLEVVAKAFLTYLVEIFRTQKTSMEFGFRIIPGAALGLLNHAKSLNLPMERILLETRNTPAEVYREFLNVGPITKGLLIASEATRGFQYSPLESFKLDRFLVSDGHWVHLQDFMECRSLVVNNTLAKPMYSVNTQRLNEFFKAWQRSSCRLNYLQVSVSHSQRLSFAEVTMGLNGTNYVRTGFFQSLDIERMDGRKARIQLNQMDLTLEKRN